MKPRLQLLIYSLGIALASVLVKTHTVDIFQLFNVTTLIYSTLSTLTSYAPKILGSAKQGLGYGVGFNMVGGNGCKCDNKYTNDSIIKVVRDKVSQLPNQTKALLSLQSRSGSKSQLQTQTERHEDEFLSGSKIQEIHEPLSVNINPVKEGHNLCTALESSGFNPKWTMTDIETMKQTEKGRKMLRNIDIRVRELTGLTTITNNDLIRCYPHYYTDYVCRLGAKPDDVSGTSSKFKHNPKPIEVPDHVPSEFGQHESGVKDVLNIFPGSVKHCHWDSLKKDLHQSISSIMSSGYNIVEKQKLVTTLNYLKVRSELELRNLINLFQSKNKTEWIEFFHDSVEREPRGYHIEGTTYYIPWDLFRKYDVCFGGQKLK